jgi:hypothetical protein
MFMVALAVVTGLGLVKNNSAPKSDINFFKHKGVCFAEKGSGNAYTFTSVDCTPEVEHAIGEKHD